MIEIERKFLVKNNDFILLATKKYHLKQAYLSSVPQRTVRIRIADKKAYMTIKGESSVDGTSRFEWEKEIAVADAKKLMELAEPHPIEKTRYIVPLGKHTFEIDVFHGIHAGLILAEVELNDPDEEFSKPSFLGIEVTGNKKYYNSYIKNNPYQK